MDNVTDSDLKNYISRVLNLSVWKKGAIEKPHKYILLLAIIQLLEEDVSHPNKFPFKELEGKFDELWTEYGSIYCAAKGLLEFPYYHLISSGLWHHKVKQEAESRYKEYQNSRSPRYRFTKRRILETIEHAYLESRFYLILSNPEARQQLRSAILKHIKDQLRNVSTIRETTSLFRHEMYAIEAINKAVQQHALGKTVSNLDIYDSQTNDYYECDLVVVAGSGIYVVELKHWSGHIRIAPYNWVRNEVGYRRDPHAANRFKAKILKGIYQHKFRTYPNVWSESVVVLTNPNAEVEGATSPKTDKHCPTFDSVDKFMDYLRHRKKVVTDRTLTEQQIDCVVDYLESLRGPRREKSYSFPGYEVVDHLTQRPDLIELIARPTDGRYRNLNRFRIFFLPHDAEPLEKQRFVRRARNTLDAVSRIGDHPNTLKVWSVPDERGALIEGSDWSEEGTLRDLLDSRKEPFSVEDAVHISHGILNALGASHKQSVVHRAVKPENVLMQNNVPKLMNFDLSYQLESGEHLTVIPDVSALKRDAYTAPEVLRGEDIDERTDLFGLGVILYEMLTGERPFKASTDLDRIGGRLSRESIKKLKKKGVPDRVCDAIDGVIRLNRQERLKTAEEMLVALDVLKEDRKSPGQVTAINQELETETSYDVYVIKDLIAKGLESQVYRAETVENEDVALKLFNQDVPLSRIQNEERAASTVRSSYLVRAKRLGYWVNDRYFLELNFVDGDCMREGINSDIQPDLDAFRSVASCLLQAVSTLHQIPLLHSDIKPDNIILTVDNKSVLIDFGIAGPPRIDKYQGTDGYVAPDLMRGADLQFCQDGDLFALGVSLFEWLYGRHPYDRLGINESPIDPADIRTDVPKPLEQWLLKAVQTVSESRFRSIDDMQEAFIASLQKPSRETETTLEEPVGVTEEPEPAEAIAEFPEREELGNPFVAYLNSLHNATVNNENALAESQAISPYFGYIHVHLKVTDYIHEQLTQKDGCHVILTGHAGDGKSTIGLELFKRLKGIPHEQTLLQPMQPREEISSQNGSIVLIKDMSELSDENRTALLEDICKDTNHRYFIVSNTGTLLNGFKQIADRDWRGFQNNLLQALESSEPQSLEHKDSNFQLINLAQVDNIDTACEVFERMIDSARWDVCKNLDCHKKCPIYQNVQILQEHWEVTRWRVELVYRRLREYGCRLTLRQITGHLAYAITAGLNYGRIKQFSEQAVRPTLQQFLFFNRFFGDYGDAPDPMADQLKAIRDIRGLEAGCRPHPKLDRQLWMKDTEGELPHVGEGLKAVYENLRGVGAGRGDNDTLSPQCARVQVRRLLYCYGQYDSPRSEKEFVSTFLNSPMLADFVNWQRSGGDLSLVERRKLKRNLLHVLQEHFTGVRLPENAGDQETLYITLNRRSYEIRQSAQIVLAKVLSDDFELVLEPHDSGISAIQYQLKLQAFQNENSLVLDLPFLDYVTSRHHGEIAQRLQTFYVDRLERFKIGLLAHERDERPQNMMLVRLQLNHTFRSQVFSIHDKILEVV